jgi:hypothetical protein
MRNKIQKMSKGAFKSQYFFFVKKVHVPGLLKGRSWAVPQKKPGQLAS